MAVPRTGTINYFSRQGHRPASEVDFGGGKRWRMEAWIRVNCIGSSVSTYPTFHDLMGANLLNHRLGFIWGCPTFQCRARIPAFCIPNLCILGDPKALSRCTSSLQTRYLIRSSYWMVSNNASVIYNLSNVEARFLTIWSNSATSTRILGTQSRVRSGRANGISGFNWVGIYRSSYGVVQNWRW